MSSFTPPDEALPPFGHRDDLSRSDNSGSSTHGPSLSIPGLINLSLQPTDQNDNSLGVEEVLGPAVQSPTFHQMVYIDVFDLPAWSTSPGDHHFFGPESPSDLSSILAS